MNSIGNLLWLLLGGIVVAIIYWIVGLLMCITIIGIPFGIQLFKLGSYALWPFGHELVDRPGEPGCLSIVMNLIWILLGWWEIAIRDSAFQDGAELHLPVREGGSAEGIKRGPAPG